MVVERVAFFILARSIAALTVASRSGLSVVVVVSALAADALAAGGLSFGGLVFFLAACRACLAAIFYCSSRINRSCRVSNRRLANSAL